MLRRLEFCKHLARALLVLFLAACVGEICLRVQRVSAPLNRDSQELDGILVVPSRVTHHQLRPSMQIELSNPDTGEPVKIRTNAFGLRGAEPQIPKPPHRYRILCLGDETVLGLEVAEHETFCSRLQTLLQSRSRLQIEVMNGGVPDFCPLLSYLQLKHQLLALQPDLLVLHFDMSDVADDYSYRRHTVMDAGEVPLACPHPRLDTIDAATPLRLADEFLVARWCTRQIGGLWHDQAEPAETAGIESLAGRYGWLKDDAPDWSIHIRQALTTIGQMQLLSEGIYARLILASSPAPWQVSGSASAAARAEYGIPQGAVYSGNAPFAMLAHYAGERQIPFCDVSPTFRSVRDPEQLYLQSSPRFSAKGHELYAVELGRCIMRSVPGIWAGSESGSAPTPLTRQPGATTR